MYVLDRAWLPRVVAVVLFYMALIAGATAAREAEHSVKAAFLLQFLNFVKCQGEPEPVGTMVLGIIGQSPVSAILADSASQLAGRNVIVKQFSNAKDARNCRLVFFASSEQSRLDSHLKALSGASVVTVGEVSDFLAVGGMINLIIEDGRVQFTVNVNAAQRAGVTLSSKLIRIAYNVRHEGYRVQP